jgi:3-dehydroquinate synthase
LPANPKPGVSKKRLNAMGNKIAISEPIMLKDDTWKEVNQFIAAGKYNRIFVLTDTNTHHFCLSLFRKKVNFKFEEITVKPGEKSKSLDSAVKIWKHLLEFQASRNSCLINLGGGMIGDLGGFVAGTYKRGMHFIHFPTTLLAMTDAAIGGKTGINFEGLKNNVGLFAMPDRVFVYPGFLNTLPFSELKNGWAEVVKHGFIEGLDLYGILKQKPGLNTIEFEKIIGLSANIKQQIVQKDFKESGLRKILNAGHTIGHALESASRETGKPLTHGEAVVLGLKTELFLAFQQHILHETDFNEMMDIIAFYYAGLQFPRISFDQLIPYLQQDKKNLDKSVSFSLAAKPGRFLIDQYFDLQAIQTAYEKATK